MKRIPFVLLPSASVALMSLVVTGPAASTPILPDAYRRPPTTTPAPSRATTEHEAQHLLATCPDACFHWEARTDFPGGVEGAAAATIGDQIYVLKGQALHIFDVAADTWSSGPNAPGEHSEGAGAAVGTDFYVTGGRVGAGPMGALTSALHRFDTIASTWSSLAPMTVARGGLALVAIDGGIHAIGGRSGISPHTGSPFAAHEAYDPTTGVWTDLAPLPTAVGDCYAATGVGRQIYVFGGWDGSTVTGTTQIYDLDTNTWTTGAEMPTARSNALAAALGSYHVVAGGVNLDPAARQSLSVLEIYDPISDLWCAGPNKLTASSEMASGGAYTNSVLNAIGSGPLGLDLPVHEALMFADLDAPTITCPSDLTIECPADPDAITAWLSQATASDNCSEPTIATQLVTHTPGCGTTYQETWEFTATDRTGLSTSCTAQLFVVDLTAPVIAGVPANQTAECDDVPAPAEPTASDSCDATPTLAYDQTRSDGSCEDDYTLTRTWTAIDSCNNAAVASQVITVVDTTSPTVTGILEPTAPLPAQSANSAASVCSAPTTRELKVVCASDDNCDPAPFITAKLIATQATVDEDGVCSAVVSEVVVSCDQIVEVVLLASPCPAEGPTSARPATSVNSSGTVVIFGESVVLEVRAEDRCGNVATDSFDPATEPSPLCDDVLADGTCCPPVGQPPSDCESPCGQGVTESPFDRSATAASKRSAATPENSQARTQP